jgi:hypothetical protein
VYVHGGPATIQNAGLIQSLSTIVTRAGVQLESGGFVSNTGTIEDLNASGVMLNSGISTLDNSGLIAGRNLGVIASGATANVANYGVIEASGTASFADFGLTAAMPAGIELRNGGTIYNAAKADVSGVYGVYLAPSSGTFTLTNAGTITGTSKAGICMPSGSGGTIINEAGATIVGASGAYITATSATTVFNAGVIAGTVNSGLIFHGAAYVQNSGTITGTAHNAMSADAAHGTLVNEAGGYLKGLRALFTSYSAYLTNFGTMIGTSYGVWANQAATVTNAGQITGVYGGIDGFGGIITNAVGGTISGTGGAGNGVDIRGGVGTVVNAGLIKGFGTAATNGGVLLNGGGTVNNSGTILNLSGTGVMVFNGVATVENSGTIAGLDMGVIALGGTAAAALATVANYGVIQATGFTDFSDFGVTTNIPTAIELKNGGTLLNGAPGSITGQTGVYAQGNAVVTNAGLIQGVSFGVDANGTGATLANSGVISASNGIGVNLLGGGTLTDSGTISGTTDAVSFGSGFSELVLVPGAELLGSVAATSLGGLVLASAASAGSFDMGGSVTGFSQITFETGAQWTLGGTTAELTGNGTNIINGFAAGDTLIVEGFTATSNTFVSILGTDNDTLLLSNGLTALNVNFTGAFGLNPFIVTDVAAGTQITLCYLQGTRILTPTGERCVEDLAIGDLVVTRQGGFAPITWIGRQSYAGAFLAHNPDKAPVCVKAGALAQTMPRRDLWLSPGHAVFVEGALVLAKALVNGVTVTQDEAPETVEYYAIELDGHDCLFAEGAWAESYADGPGLRAQFHNLDDHRARFPGYVEPETIALCAPRPEAGPALAAALAPVVARAAALVQPGALRGVVDLIEADGLVEGWAQDAANPDLPVALEICLGETVLGRVLACDYREDLAAAGIGHGRAKFSFTVPGGLDDATRAGVVVRRGSDGAALPYSEELVRRVA